jgi:hypothetical protein
MAKKKKEEEVVDPAFTITHQGDKNGAASTVVEGQTTADDNSPVEIHCGGMVFNGGTTISGAFRAIVPFTEDEIAVVINGERV